MNKLAVVSDERTTTQPSQYWDENRSGFGIQDSRELPIPDEAISIFLNICGLHIRSAFWYGN